MTTRAICYGMGRVSMVVFMLDFLQILICLTHSYHGIPTTIATEGERFMVNSQNFISSCVGIFSSEAGFWS